MKRAIGILLAAAIFFAGARFAAAQGEETDARYRDDAIEQQAKAGGGGKKGAIVTYSAMLRYETHTAEDPPGTNAGLNDDFFYSIFSMTGQITKHVLLNGFVGYRYGVELNNERESILLGANYLLNYPTYRVTVGYSYNDTDYAASRLDSDRLSLSVMNVLNRPNSRKNLMLTTTLAGKTDWSEGRTWNEKLELPYTVNKRGSGSISYTYGHNLVVGGQIYNQYSAVYGYALGKRTRLSAEYLFVQRTDSFNVSGFVYHPDDDNVIRLTWMQTY